MNKKESILHEAMILFAERGLFGVSTQQIAKQAKVSEGLIFKHYGSKEGLLQAVFSNGHACVQSLMTKVAQLSTAKEKLNALLDFPLIMMKEKPNFWKLSFTIKLQHPDLYMRLQPTTDSPDITEFLHSVLLQLGAKDPKLETMSLLVFFEGIVHTMIKHPEMDIIPLIEQRKNKY